MPDEPAIGRKLDEASRDGRKLTPLWVISIFVSLTEVVLGVAASRTAGGIQIALVGFVMIFPLLIAGAFFACLWERPWVFYPPSEYGGIDVLKYVQALKAGPGRVVKETKDVEGPIQVVGEPDRLRLLFKTAAPTWVRSTKAMETGSGCIVQVSTKFMTTTGDWNVAEAVTYVPGVRVVDGAAGGRYLTLST